MGFNHGDIEGMLNQMYEKQVVDVGFKLLTSDAQMPKYGSEEAAGMDLYTVGKDLVVEGHTTILVPTGLSISLPIGYELQIRSRSGIAAKTKLRIGNGVGTIDSDYKGEIKIIIDNIGDEPITIENGTRLAQGIISELVPVRLSEVKDVGNSERGDGGFNSTGLK